MRRDIESGEGARGRRAGVLPPDGVQAVRVRAASSFLRSFRRRRIRCRISQNQSSNATRAADSHCPSVLSLSERCIVTTGRCSHYRSDASCHYRSLFTSPHKMTTGRPSSDDSCAKISPQKSKTSRRQLAYTSGAASRAPACRYLLTVWRNPWLAAGRYRAGGGRPRRMAGALRLEAVRRCAPVVGAHWSCSDRQCECVALALVAVRTAT